MIKPLTYKEMRKRLRGHDQEFEFKKHRGKGSERLIYHPDIDGSPASYPVKCHGEGTELRKGTLKAIQRRFNLPNDIFS